MYISIIRWFVAIAGVEPAVRAECSNCDVMCYFRRNMKIRTATTDVAIALCGIPELYIPVYQKK